MNNPSFKAIITKSTELLEQNRMPMRAVCLWNLVKKLNPTNEFVQLVETRKGNFPVELGQVLRYDTPNIATFKMSNGDRFFVFTLDQKK